MFCLNSVGGKPSNRVKMAGCNPLPTGWYKNVMLVLHWFCILLLNGNYDIGMTEYGIREKVSIVDEYEGGDMTQLDIAEKYGISRQTLINWRDKVDDMRAEVRDMDFRDRMVALDGELGAVAEYEKRYLAKLEDLGDLADRKRVFVSGLEKVMWDHLDALDGQRFDDINAKDRVKMLKDMNEIREKLAGEPGVVMEYRAKFQVAVMQVVREMLPDRADEFIERIKMVEDNG